MPDTRQVERLGISIAMEAFEGIGFAFREQTVSDFGIDAHAELLIGGEATGRLIGIQIKSGSSYFNEVEGNTYVFRIDQKHTSYWLGHSLPVIVCLCNIERRRVCWEVVLNETTAPTGVNAKILIPKNQIIDRQSRGRLADLVTPVIASDRYTIFTTEDVSHILAKRYSFDVVLNGTFTKSEIAAVVRKITNEGAKRRYYRNHIVAGKWGESDAHIVGTFVYASAEDLSRRNRLCRSLWIHPQVDLNSGPTMFEGENVGDGIIVEWNSDYETIAQLYLERTLTKEEYLATVVPVVDELSDLFEKFSEPFRAYRDNEFLEEDFVLKAGQILGRFHEISDTLIDMSHAPYECAQVELVLQSLVCNISNLCMYFAPEGLIHWERRPRRYLTGAQWDLAIEGLRNIKYELSKITGLH